MSDGESRDNGCDVGNDVLSVLIFFFPRRAYRYMLARTKPIKGFGGRDARHLRSAAAGTASSGTILNILLVVVIAVPGFFF